MLKFVQRVGDYHYFRPTNGKRVRLPGAEGSPEYVAAYERALASATTATAIASETKRDGNVAFMAGSLGWTIEKYLASNEFRDKAHGTQAAYQVMLRTLRDEPIARGLVRDLNRQHVNVHCSEIEKRFGRSRGDHQAMIISILWDYADRHLPQCRLNDRANPTRRRKRFKTKPRDAWTPAVQRRFLDGASAELKLAFALLLYTGQRRGDVCKMRWSDLDTGYVSVVQEKTDEHVPIRVHRELAAVLAKTERCGETILTTKTGRPFLKTALTKAIKQRLREIGEPNLVLHGLRKSAGVKLAESGASVQQIMTVLGHRTPRMALFYCAQANKRKLSDEAMKLWERAA
ncbi:MAG TPA: tyrosine-type recombinase/integrase [Candidatus Cybelea sp.]|nr:tyrosine-type recombinase/integrase [Candidatus Cybelea sp.]